MPQTWWRNTNCYLRFLEVRCQMGLAELKSNCWQGRVPPGGSRESPSTCLSSFQRLPMFLGSRPPSIFNASSSQQSLPHCTTLTLNRFPPSFTFKYPCAYTRPTWIIQGNLPIPRSLTLYLQSLFCQIRSHIHRSGDYDMDIFGGLLFRQPQWTRTVGASLICGI